MADSEKVRSKTVFFITKLKNILGPSLEFPGNPDEVFHECGNIIEERILPMIFCPVDSYAYAGNGHIVIAEASCFRLTC